MRSVYHAIDEIRSLMRRHLHWHPFKFTSKMMPLDNGSPVTSRFVWLHEAMEMHELCNKLNEGNAWEYLWTNWYRLDKWQIWREQQCWIITLSSKQTRRSKYCKLELSEKPRPSLSYSSTPQSSLLRVHNTTMPLIINKIRQYRKDTKDCS
jgi:hypothetical protein